MWREFLDFAVRGNVVDLGGGLILQDAVRPGRDAGIRYLVSWTSLQFGLGRSCACGRGSQG
jgi:hypothetical protein